MMAQIAPQLTKKLTDINPNLSPREKLLNKIKESNQSRCIKEVKVAQHESDMNYDKNIIDLYAMQKSFTQSINMADLDDF